MIESLRKYIEFSFLDSFLAIYLEQWVSSSVFPHLTWYQSKIEREDSCFLLLIMCRSFFFFNLGLVWFLSRSPLLYFSSTCIEPFSHFLFSVLCNGQPHRRSDESLLSSSFPHSWNVSHLPNPWSAKTTLPRVAPSL